MKLPVTPALVACVAAAAVAAGPAAARTSGAASVVKVSAPPLGLKFDTKVLRAHPGKIKIVFTNRSTIQHNVRIESGENELGGTKTLGKGLAVAFLTLKKGTYNFYCSVPGHEAAGMKGKLVVS